MISAHTTERRSFLSTLDDEAETEPGFARIIADSPTMRDAIARAQRAARTDSTVLVVGASGTGTELIAEGIHRSSRRSGGPFVVVNMAAIPEALVESELFGHVKGAFTGANSDRIGRFQAADGGTLFIDEIGDFPLESQAKLLRALESLTVTPVGSCRERTVDVRVVAATSRDLRKMLREGTFREDLYYRLNVITLQLPPLRERDGDIALLTETFLRQLCAQAQRPVPEVHQELAEFFETFDWPGNVRQLRNCLESMVVMARGDALTLDDLPPHLHCPAGGDEDDEIRIPPGTPLEVVERKAILQALDYFRGNRIQAAESLGISVRTLQRRLKTWGTVEAVGLRRPR